MPLIVSPEEVRRALEWCAELYARAERARDGEQLREVERIAQAVEGLAGTEVPQGPPEKWRRGDQR